MRLGESGHAGLGAVALYGLGGIGKTEIVAEYAYRHLDDYDLIAWLPATQTPTIISSLSSLATRLGITRLDSNEELIAELWVLLRARSRWLLIFDDVQDREEIASYWPRADSGHVIVTSRSRFWADVAVPCEVPTFERAESVSFVTNRAKTTADLADVDLLASELGDLPLALEQALSS